MSRRLPDGRGHTIQARNMYALEALAPTYTEWPPLFAVEEIGDRDTVEVSA